jgi:MYXO-CTERM domain-containing protein
MHQQSHTTRQRLIPSLLSLYINSITDTSHGECIVASCRHVANWLPHGSSSPNTVTTTTSKSAVGMRQRSIKWMKLARWTRCSSLSNTLRQRRSILGPFWSSHAKAAEFWSLWSNVTIVISSSSLLVSCWLEHSWTGSSDWVASCGSAFASSSCNVAVVMGDGANVLLVLAAVGWRRRRRRQW